MSQFSSVLFPSAVVTTTTNTNSVNNTPPLTQGHIIVNVSARTSGSITPSIEGYDPASTTWYTILTGTAISAVGQAVLKVGPAFTVAANVSVADMLPQIWRVKLTAAASTSLTASVGINLAP
jgi:hypothetical protein